MRSISMSKRWLIVNLVKCYHNIHLISNIQSVSSWSWHLGGLSFPQCFSSPLSLSSSFLFSNPPFDFHFLLLSTFSIIHFPILSLFFMCIYSQISDTSNSSTNLREFFDSSDILISESCFGFSVNLHLKQVGTHPHPDSSQEIFTQGDFDSVLFTLHWRLFCDLVFPLRLLGPEAHFVFNFMSSFWPSLKMVRMFEQLSSLRGDVLSRAWLNDGYKLKQCNKT